MMTTRYMKQIYWTCIVMAGVMAALPFFTGNYSHWLTLTVWGYNIVMWRRLLKKTQAREKELEYEEWRKNRKRWIELE